MITLNEELCTGCATCLKVCPHRVFEVEKKKSALAFEERCIECGACELNCLGGAIQVTKGTGCLYIIVKEDILHLKGDGVSCGCG